MKVEMIMQALEARHPGEKEYLQAVREVLLSIADVYNESFVCHGLTTMVMWR